MAATTVSPARASERVDFRSASARLRVNAGIDDRAAVAAVATFAEVGAAARRLRASNAFTEPTVRERHPAAGVAEPVLQVLEPVEEPVVVLDDQPVGLDDEPIVIDLPACEVIYLDPQIGRRKIAAASDRQLRQASLAQRAATLLAAIEDAKLALV